MNVKIYIRKLKTGMTIRYAIALSLIAVLSTFAFFFLNSALSDSDSTAYIVNISGKQRMLSQHIALDVYRIRESFLSSEERNQVSNDLYKQYLKNNIEEMLIANRMLTSGKLLNDQTVELSDSIYDMYFDQMNLDQRVKRYTLTAKQILEVSSYQQANQIVKRINMQSEKLLADLNKVVKQYEIEGDEQLLLIKQMEIIVWVSTLIALLFEAVFIFRPMVNHIIQLSEAEERSIENLQHQVEIRTLHLRKANQKLKDIASRDPLTQLKNRLNLEQNLEEIIAQFIEHHAPYAVLMIDIDWFKKVNDNYGHDVGDLVLIETAEILKKNTRQDDKAYRFGGEEFVVILNRISFEDASNWAEKIRATIASHCFNINGNELKQTISGGLYHSSNKEDCNVKAILKGVDEALYKSKANGRNKISNVD